MGIAPILLIFHARLCIRHRMVSDTKYLDITLWPQLPQGWPPMAEPFAAIAFYFLLILLAKLWMQFRAPYDLSGVLKVHNIFLAASSAIMCVGLGLNVLRSTLHSGVFGAFCQSTEALDRGIFWWMQVYYLSKFPEFLDTVFLVLKGRFVVFFSVFRV